MEYLNAFLCGGVLCAIGQVLIDKTQLTPARILHVDSQKGSLEEGKDADIVIFDNQINVTTTISKGHVIYNQ